tara:strand:- start:19 stop:204 length:186 start_codon:yes stop_codon:yes gene_type:complete
MRVIIDVFRDATVETGALVFAKFCETEELKVEIVLNPPFDIIIGILAGIGINNAYIIIFKF